MGEKALKCGVFYLSFGESVSVVDSNVMFTEKLFDLADIRYRSDSGHCFMKSFLFYNDDYIAVVGYNLAEKWLQNMQFLLYDKNEKFDQQLILKAKNMAKESLKPRYVAEENVALAVKLIISSWNRGREFGEKLNLPSEEIDRIQSHADFSFALHHDYKKVLQSEKIKFSSERAEKYWNFKKNSCDVRYVDAISLAEDWIKITQIYMKLDNTKKISPSLLHESALYVRRHNELANKMANSNNVLKISDDSYQRVVQMMLCCWEQGENVAQIHSSEDKIAAKIRRFPFKDASFRQYTMWKQKQVLCGFAKRFFEKFRE